MAREVNLGTLRFKRNHGEDILGKRLDGEQATCKHGRRHGARTDVVQVQLALGGGAL